MFQTLERVNSAANAVQSSLPSSVHIETHRLTFASFPILGYSLTSDSVRKPICGRMATYDIKPRLNRLDGVSHRHRAGGEEPEFQISPEPAKLLETHVTVTDISGGRPAPRDLIDSPASWAQSPALFGIGQLAGPHAGRDFDIVVKTTKRRGRRPIPHQ